LSVVFYLNGNYYGEFFYSKGETALMANILINRCYNPDIIKVML